MERRRRQRKVEKRRRLIFIVLMLLLIPLLLQGIRLKNRLITIKLEDVEYVEFIKFAQNQMVTVKNKKQVKNILRKINGFTGKNVGSDLEIDKEVSFMNVYTKTHGKIEFAKTDEYIGINGNWYKVSNKTIEQFNQFFEEYF